MQFTFSIDTPPGSFPATSSSYTFSGEGSAATAPTPSLQASNAPDGSSENPSSASGSNSNVPSFQSSYEASYEKLHFPPLFSTSFGPTALFYFTPTLTNPMSYGEGVSGGCAI
ncbi:hypothetical protein M405DRAFT_869543, partial [Rhizopogon salebrosus TDB-379]